MEANSPVSKRGSRKERGRWSWHVVGMLLWILVVLSVVATIFPLLYKSERRAWHSKWQDACNDRGALLESGFKKSILLFTTLAVTMERFYFWPEQPQIDLKGFQAYLSLITPNTFVGNALVTRLLMPDTLPAYEKKTNKTVIDWTTKQPTKPNRIYRVPELVANPLSVPNIGYDMSRAWSGIIPTDVMAQCIENDIIVYSRPALASTNPVSKYMPQYMFAAMKFAYRGGRPSVNATPAERFASCIGGFSVHFDIWNIVESVSTSLKEGKHLVVKLVDVTEKNKPPQPMYVPTAELNSSRGNWTFDDYSYKTAPNIAASRQYELWCRLAPGTDFFPVKAVAYSAAALLLGLSIAQLWWVHFRSLSVSKEQCRAAIRLKDEMVLAKQASDEHSAAKSAFVASVSHEIRTPMNALKVMAKLGDLFEQDIVRMPLLVKLAGLLIFTFRAFFRFGVSF